MIHCPFQKYFYADMIVFLYRVSIGDNSLLGDLRWGGLFGVEAEFFALEDVKVENDNFYCDK
jgi:hypothetical protein